MSRKAVQLKQVQPGGVNKNQATELLLQALETELGGVQVYEAAILLAQDAGLRREWEVYLDQTRNHVRILRDVFDELGLDLDLESPGRLVVREISGALVHAMAMAHQDASRDAAQLVAAECVILAETKDHFNWMLIGALAQSLKGSEAKLLRTAHAEVAGEEDAHLHHTVGWARELWFKSLGLRAALPPPEETGSQEERQEPVRPKVERTRPASVAQRQA